MGRVTWRKPSGLQMWAPLSLNRRLGLCRKDSCAESGDATKAGTGRNVGWQTWSFPYTESGVLRTNHFLSIIKLPSNQKRKTKSDFFKTWQKNSERNCLPTPSHSYVHDLCHNAYICAHIHVCYKSTHVYSHATHSCTCTCMWNHTWTSDLSVCKHVYKLHAHM